MIKRLLIRCPSSILTALVPTEKQDCDIEQFGGDTYLRLMVQPSNYKPIKTFKNQTQYVRSLATTQYRLQTYVREFEVKADGRAYLFDVVQEISRQSLSADLQTQTPIQIVDFVMPESKDRISAQAAQSEAYTIRTGLLKEINASSGTVGDGMITNEKPEYAWISDGFSFKFEDLILRRD